MCVCLGSLEGGKFVLSTIKKAQLGSCELHLWQNEDWAREAAPQTRWKAALEWQGKASRHDCGEAGAQCNQALNSQKDLC